MVVRKYDVREFFFKCKSVKAQIYEYGRISLPIISLIFSPLLRFGLPYLWAIQCPVPDHPGSICQAVLWHVYQITLDIGWPLPHAWAS